MFEIKCNFGVIITRCAHKNFVLELNQTRKIPPNTTKKAINSLQFGFHGNQANKNRKGNSGFNHVWIQHVFGVIMQDRQEGSYKILEYSSCLPTTGAEQALFSLYNVSYYSFILIGYYKYLCSTRASISSFLRP